jgi:hypothetical protein
MEYQIYHKSFTIASETARELAMRRGYEVDTDSWMNEVAMGGSTGRGRPSAGETTRFTVELLRNGKSVSKCLHFQVYGMKNSYELAAYIN